MNLITKTNFVKLYPTLTVGSLYFDSEGDVVMFVDYWEPRLGECVALLELYGGAGSAPDATPTIRRSIEDVADYVAAFGPFETSGISNTDIKKLLPHG